MNLYDKLLEKSSDLATTTETAIGKIHVLTGNVKERFTAASADAEEVKQKKKRKRENAKRVPKINKKDHLPQPLIY